MLQNMRSLQIGEKYLEVAVILPWSRSVLHIAWRWTTALLAGSAVVTKVFHFLSFFQVRLHPSLNIWIKLPMQSIAMPQEF